MSNLNQYYKVYKLFLKNLKFKNIKYKPLIKGLKRFGGGRNKQGVITIRNRGGGAKRLYKKICFNYYYIINFKFFNWVVERIEYDSNRSGSIALISSNFSLNQDFQYYKLLANSKRKIFNIYYLYILANKGLKKGDLVSLFNINMQNFPLDNQWSSLQNVLTGSKIFNVELRKYSFGKIARSAGTFCKLLRKYENHGLILMPSGQKKLISLNSFVSIGEVSNSNHNLKKKYKAGNNRWLGRKPCVRGVAKNPVDHPHGGGNGKSSGGRKSVSPWGTLTKGFVTVRKKKRKLKKKYVTI